MNSQLFTSQKSYDLQKANTEIKLIPIEKEYLYDKTFYMSYSMYSPKDNKGNGNGYSIIMNTHTLEKALSPRTSRPTAPSACQGSDRPIWPWTSGAGFLPCRHGKKSAPGWYPCQSPHHGLKHHWPR